VASQASVWVEAARPKTLPAALAPVLVGTAVASRFVAWRALAALVVALALQVAVNFANDYFDGVAGVDTAERTGPRRVVAAGLVEPRAMVRAIAVALAVAGVAGLSLAVAVGWELVAVGAVAMLAALGYSGGRRPYASRGLGEVSVFIFFGLVATVGSQYVHDESWSWLAVLVAVPVGLIATAILVANNLRDIPTDAATGKRTLAVRLGEPRTRTLFVVLVAGAFVMLVPIVLVTGGWAAAPFLALPLATRAVQLIRRAPLGPRLVAALETTGRLHLAFGALLAAGLVLDRVVG
jgi:1,4-dihydroxy-2-naphthoate polyprenyltransferase